MSIKSSEPGETQREIIPLAAVLGAAFYIILMLLEASLHPQILFGAALGSLVIGLLATVFIWQNEHTKHLGEMIILWVMIFCFVTYGLLCFGGVL